MLQTHGLTGRAHQAETIVAAGRQGLLRETVGAWPWPGSVRRLGAGEALFHEGDAADAAFEVIEGVLKLYKLLPDGRRQIVGFAYPGDFLGLAVRSHHVYTAEAVAEVKLIRLPRSRLEAMVEEVPGLARRFWMLARDELVEAQDQMLLLGRKSPLEKVASFLLRLSERRARQDGDAERIDLSMSRTDIADYLGLTIETVSRCFTRLRKSGIVDLPRPSRVVVRDLDRLADLAEGTEGSEGDACLSRESSCLRGRLAPLAAAAS